jgi:TRAP transporter 4TM/12TM fusion protein
MAESTDGQPAAAGWERLVARALALVLTSAALAWAADVPRLFGFLFIDEQFNAFILAIALALVYLVMRGRRGHEGRPPWYDMVAALVGLAAALYVAYDYRALADSIAQRPLHGVLIGGIILLLTLEGLRRASGNVLTVILLFFIAYGFFGHLVPGTFEGRRVNPEGLLLYLSLDVNGVFGSVFGVAATVVVTYLFFGALLERSGGGDFFNDVATAAFGRSRGGSAKVAVVSSLLFGTISGNAVANVVVGGIVTIPMMKKAGYKPHDAAAIEAVASTGGQLQPPVMGAAAFIMAELLGVPYSEIAIAATIPAFLYYAALYIQSDLEAGKRNIAPVPADEIPSFGSVLLEGWHFLVPLVVIIVGLFWLNQTPELAAIYSSASLIACGLLKGYRGRRMRLRDVYESLIETGRTSLDILMIAAAAGFIIGILNVTGLSFALTIALVHLGGGNQVLLLVLAAGIAIVLGMGMPTVGVYVLLAALVAPALTEVGIPALAAHLFVLYFGMMSMITPPVAVAAYAAASIGQADFMRTGLSGVRFGWSAYIVPFLFVFSPTLLMHGNAAIVILDLATATMGIYLACAAITGFVTRPVGIPLRLALGLAGIALILPTGIFQGAAWVNIAGFVIGLILIASQLDLLRQWRAVLRRAA